MRGEPRFPLNPSFLVFYFAKKEETGRTLNSITSRKKGGSGGRRPRVPGFVPAERRELPPLVPPLVSSLIFVIFLLGKRIGDKHSQLGPANVSARVSQECPSKLFKECLL